MHFQVTLINFSTSTILIFCKKRFILIQNFHAYSVNKCMDGIFNIKQIFTDVIQNYKLNFWKKKFQK